MIRLRILMLTVAGMLLTVLAELVLLELLVLMAQQEQMALTVFLAGILMVME
jgi:hypothetical protein